jgi:DNA-binding transcriptional LysR family regulator
MEQGTAEHQFNLLRDRRCEVVVSRLITSVPESDIEMQPMFNEPLVVVAGFRSSWARRRNIALSDLVNAPWILSSLELEDGSPFVKAFRAAGLAVPAATIVSNSLHVRNRLLEKGRFVSLVPGSALRFGPTRSALAPLPIRLPRWHLPTGAFILKERELSPLAQLFIERMREIARPLANAQWHS